MAISKVTSGGIADGTLSVEDIKDDAVTAAKLANSINTDIATGVTGNTTANAALPKAGGAMTGAITTNSTFDGVDIATRDGVLTSTTATAAAALPKAGGTMTGHTLHGDNINNNFGADNDLMIYHNGSNSYINNTTGSLYIRDSAGDIYIQAKNNENSIVANNDGSVELYHDNAKKLETTAEGILVTGSVPTIKIKGTVNDSATSGKLSFRENDNTNGFDLRYDGSANNFIIDSNNKSNAVVIGRTTGIVTMPYQPSFLVNGSPSKSSSNHIHSFGNIKHNIGSNYVNSTGRFTAPVAGRYQFNAGIWAVDNSNGYMQIRINESGDWAGAHVGDISRTSGTISVVLNLAANDYVSLFTDFNIQGSTPRNNFSGILIG